jgi:hypothetical protein
MVFPFRAHYIFEWIFGSMKRFHTAVLFLGLVLSCLVFMVWVEWFSPAVRMNHESFLAEYERYRVLHEGFRDKVLLFAAPSLLLVLYGLLLKPLLVLMALFIANGVIVVGFYTASLILP